MIALSSVDVIVARALAKRPVYSDDLQLRMPAELFATSTRMTVTDNIFAVCGGEATDVLMSPWWADLACERFVPFAPFSSSNVFFRSRWCGIFVIYAVWVCFVCFELFFVISHRRGWHIYNRRLCFSSLADSDIRAQASRQKYHAQIIQHQARETNSSHRAREG